MSGLPEERPAAASDSEPLPAEAFESVDAGSVVGVGPIEADPDWREKAAAERVRAILAAREPREPAGSGEDQRFSVLGILGLVSLAAVVFAIGRRLEAGSFAFWTGLGALGSMFGLSQTRQPGFSLRLVCWLLLGIYAVAILRKFFLS